MTENFTPAKAGTQRPRLSKEEYAEKKRAEKDGVYQLADEAAKEIVSSPEKFKAFLDTQSRLDRYSAVNALLIYKQYPQAVQLKDFDDWSKDNIKITKGAKSISILEPVEYAKRNCVAQELGHAQLSINSDSYSRSDMGFQAVCIGYMLCKKYGIDTQNFAINRILDKLANKEPKDIRFELSKTRNAMAIRFEIAMCEDSVKTRSSFHIFLLAYAMGIGIYFSTRRTTAGVRNTALRNGAMQVL